MTKKVSPAAVHRPSRDGRYEVRLNSRNETVTVSSPIRAKILEQTEKLIAASERKGQSTK